MVLPSCSVRTAAGEAKSTFASLSRRSRLLGSVPRSRLPASLEQRVGERRVRIGYIGPSAVAFPGEMRVTGYCSSSRRLKRIPQRKRTEAFEAAIYAADSGRSTPHCGEPLERLSPADRPAQALLGDPDLLILEGTFSRARIRSRSSNSVARSEQCNTEGRRRVRHTFCPRHRLL